MGANPRTSDVKSAFADRLTREREEADMAARERVLRGELALETYLTVYRGYSAKFLANVRTKYRRSHNRRRVH